MPAQLEGSTVDSLIQLDRKKWDDDILLDICNERDRKLIKKIPLPAQEGGDAWYWLPDEEGCFTVRSCYRLLQGEIDNSHAQFWNKLWSLKLPGKIIHFLWRECSPCMPTSVRLTVKRVQIDRMCQWCRVYEETDIHALFECQIAAERWREAGLQGSISILPSDNVFDVLCRVFVTCNREQCTLITLMCWSLWNRRNKWVWEKINQSVFGVKAAALNMLTEWRKAHDQQLNSGTNTGTTLVIRKWEKPRDSWVKININAALFEDIDCIGLGSVVRGSNGQFLMAMSSRQDVLIPPREAEAMCLKESLIWLKDKGLQKCVFETDSQVLARACKGDKGRSLFHTIVRDCMYLFQHFEEVSVCFTHRSANRVAHALAKAARSTSDFQERHENAPDFIHHVICSEAL